MLCCLTVKEVQRCCITAKKKEKRKKNHQQCEKKQSHLSFGAGSRRHSLFLDEFTKRCSAAVCFPTYLQEAGAPRRFAKVTDAARVFFLFFFPGECAHGASSPRYVTQKEHLTRCGRNREADMSMQRNYHLFHSE